MMRIARHLIIAATTAAAAAGITIGSAAQGGDAGATTPLTVKCTGLSSKGPAQTPIQLNGCTGSGVKITGASGSQLFNTPGPGAAQVTWTTGAVIIDDGLKFNYHAAHTCARKAKYQSVSAVQVKGTVEDASGSASRMDGGQVVEQFCQYSTSTGDYLFVGYGTQQQ
jgi:hypothetical protein